MNSLNKVQLIGNLTSDPEVKQTPSGQAVANFSLATNRQWKDSAGMEQKQTEFHNIVVWGKLAEIVQSYLSKGNKVFLEGRLQTRSWDDTTTGKKNYKTEIVGENLIMLTPKSSNVDENLEDEPVQNPVKKPTTKPKPKEEDIAIEDIPF